MILLARKLRRLNMLTLRDCIDFSDLSEEEILAIAECEHIPLLRKAKAWCTPHGGANGLLL